MDKTLRGTETGGDLAGLREKAHQKVVRNNQRMDALSNALDQETRVSKFLHAGTVAASAIGVAWLWSELTAKSLVLIAVIVYGLRGMAETIIERAWRRPMMKKLNASTLEP